MNTLICNTKSLTIYLTLLFFLLFNNFGHWKWSLAHLQEAALKKKVDKCWNIWRQNKTLGTYGNGAYFVHTHNWIYVIYVLCNISQHEKFKQDWKRFPNPWIHFYLMKDFSICLIATGTFLSFFLFFSLVFIPLSVSPLCFICLQAHFHYYGTTQRFFSWRQYSKKLNALE